MLILNQILDNVKSLFDLGCLTLVQKAVNASSTPGDKLIILWENVQGFESSDIESKILTESIFLQLKLIDPLICQIHLVYTGR